MTDKPNQKLIATIKSRLSGTKIENDRVDLNDLPPAIQSALDLLPHSKMHFSGLGAIYQEPSDEMWYVVGVADLFSLGLAYNHWLQRFSPLGEGLSLEEALEDANWPQQLNIVK